MTTATAPLDRYMAAFRDAESARNGGSREDWLTPIRRAAMERFGELGLPTTSLEEWRYTSLKGLAGIDFRPAGTRPAGGYTAEKLHSRALACGGGPIFTFVNGRFAPELSRMAEIQVGLKLLRLQEAARDHRADVEPHLARLAGSRGQAFTALNTAFLDDGACLVVAPGTVVESPVHIVFLSSAAEAAPVISHPRLLVIAGRRSQVTLVETYAGTGAGASFTNAVSEISAGEGSVVDHYKIQRESSAGFHIATIEAELGRDATYSSHSFSDGAALARNDINVLMKDQGGDCTLNGLYIASGRQHIDNHTIIDHARPHCSSREIYKGVLGGSARGVFDGKVIVRADAQKTDARQANNNLLLSDSALVDTKPQLEINADDVKCAHAATIGQLDPDSIFYLRSRGLGLAEARNLLVHGFVHEMIDRVKIGCLKLGLEGILYGRLDRESRVEASS